MHLNSGEEWLLRPVLSQLCRYESLVDGTLNLADIDVMNEFLDVRDENERRLAEAYRRSHPHG